MTCANAKHHTGAKDPLGDVDLPVVSPAIQNPANQKIYLFVSQQQIGLNLENWKVQKM